jgi:aminopeptidase YwaD
MNQTARRSCCVRPSLSFMHNLHSSRLSAAAGSFRRRLSVAALIAALCLAAASGALAAADPDRLLADVKYLASEELAGRGTGTPGKDLAAEYLAEEFRKAGLTPRGEDGFFQSFTVTTGSRLGETNRLSVRQGGTQRPLDLGAEFMPLGSTGNGYAYAPVVFAGYGISAPELGYNDYEKIDPRGKIAIVLRHTPDMDDRGKFAPYATLAYKAMAAREMGAAGILLVTGPGRDENLGVPSSVLQQARRGERPALGAASGSSDAGIPAAIVRRSVVEKLLAGAARKRDLEALQTLMAHGQPQAFDLPGVRVGMHVSIERQRTPTRNVIGFLEGSDPALKNEVVVIGAHYDHLGMGDAHSLADRQEPAIHHGADDNASGTAGVLELARHFGQNRDRLGRSLLFMGFAAEEIGLLGSSHWVKNPTIPLERVAAMINLDMIGRLRNDTVHVIGWASSPAWGPVLEAANRAHGLQLRTGAGSGSGIGGSDQQPFYNQGIPVLFFFTGVHPDYHRPSDTWEKIEIAGIARIVGLVADTAEQISRLEARPQFARAAEPERAASSPGGGGFRVYLGTIPDYAEEVEGVALAGVREGSPAEKAGLKAGDVLLQFAGQRIRNVQEYTTVLGTAQPNVPVEIVVRRDGREQRLTLTPAPPR